MQTDGEAMIGLPLRFETCRLPGSLLRPSCRSGHEKVRDCLAIEVGGQVLREQRVVFRSCHRLLDVIAVSGFGAGQGNQGGGEFHFGIRPAQTDCFGYPAVSVETGGGVGLAIAHPLLVRLGEVADVKPCEGVGATGGI